MFAVFKVRAKLARGCLLLTIFMLVFRRVICTRAIFSFLLSFDVPSYIKATKVDVVNAMRNKYDIFFLPLYYEYFKISHLI